MNASKSTRVPRDVLTLAPVGRNSMVCELGSANETL